LFVEFAFLEFKVLVSSSLSVNISSYSVSLSLSVECILIPSRLSLLFQRRILCVLIIDVCKKKHKHENKKKEFGLLYPDIEL